MNTIDTCKSDVGARYVSPEEIEAGKKRIHDEGFQPARNDVGWQGPLNSPPMADRLPEDFEGEYGDYDDGAYN